jgi:hypothetical protein
MWQTLSTVQFRMFYLSAYQNTGRINYTKL